MMDITPFFDAVTSTFTYVIADKATKLCAVIDPVLDYDLVSAKLSTHFADKIITFIEQNGLKLQWILETHAHADHLSSALYIKGKLGGKLAIGEHIKEVITYWVPIFNSFKDTPLDGSQFDTLFKDGEKFKIGGLEVEVIHTPGHTPACISYKIDDALFVGDTLFMPYVGTARTDFPGGSASELYHSIQKLFKLPNETRIFTCHDYPPEGAPVQHLSTIGEQKLKNTMVSEGVSEADYVKARNAKDKGRAIPKLLIPAIQVNIRAGDLGEKDEAGTQYIKFPINAFEKSI